MGRKICLINIDYFTEEPYGKGVMITKFTE